MRKPTIEEYLEEMRPQMEAAEQRVLSYKIDPPLFKCVNTAEWTKYVESNVDGYGRAVIVYAHYLAKALEDKILKNSYLGFNDLTKEDIKECEQIADERAEGITGFMYGAAICVLKNTWQYGKELNQYHNRQFGVEDSENTVNPAILTVS